MSLAIIGPDAGESEELGEHARFDVEIKRGVDRERWGEIDL